MKATGKQGRVGAKVELADDLLAPRFPQPPTQALFGGKASWFGMADHFVSNWMLPTGGLAVTLAAGWFMTRDATESELADGTEPAWFQYGAWRFFIRFVAPVAVAAIIIAVIFFGVDFS